MNPRRQGQWMWDAIGLLDEAERLHRRFFELAPSRGSEPAWAPPVDVLETRDRVVVVVALPGVAPECIEVIAEAGTLSVVAERAMPAIGAAASLKRLEIPYGRFERRLNLPAGRYEIERQDVEHGCLRLTLRRLR